MKVGFTGTQQGMTVYQQQEVTKILTHYCKDGGIEIAFHGDCIGADGQFHNYCRGLAIPIAIAPCTIQQKRAYSQGAKVVYGIKPPLERNRNIVDSVDVLIATPAQDHEVLRSGTWATIRYAKKVGRVIHIIYPKILNGGS